MPEKLHRCVDKVQEAHVHDWDDKDELPQEWRCRICGARKGLNETEDDACAQCNAIRSLHGMFTDHKFQTKLVESFSVGSGLSNISVGGKKHMETIEPCSCFDKVHKALVQETHIDTDQGFAQGPIGTYVTDEAGTPEGAKKANQGRAKGKGKPDKKGKGIGEPVDQKAMGIYDNQFDFMMKFDSLTADPRLDDNMRMELAALPFASLPADTQKLVAKDVIDNYAGDESSSGAAEHQLSGYWDSISDDSKRNLIATGLGVNPQDVDTGGMTWDLLDPVTKQLVSDSYDPTSNSFPNPDAEGGETSEIYHMSLPDSEDDEEDEDDDDDEIKPDKHFDKIHEALVRESN